MLEINGSSYIMEKTPLVSVVLTTFNRADRLKKAIDSVLDQSFEDYEIIVVDDFSTDKTEQVVEKYQKKDPRIKYIRRSENFGNHSKPKNDGSLAAKADLIAYLDDDNTWLKDHLQILYHVLKDRPDLGMVYGDRRIIDESRKIKPQQGIAFDWHPGILQIRNYIDTGDVLIRRKVLEELGGWDEDLKKFADWNLWVRFAKAGFIAERIPIIISEYHMHPFMAQLRHRSMVSADGQILPTFSPDGCKVYPDHTSYPPAKKLRVAVLTISWNRLNFLKETYASMHETAGYDFDHYLVMNEASEEEQTWTQGNSFSSSAFLPTNQGCPSAYNIGLQMMIATHKNAKQVSDAYDIVVLTDNDVKFKSNNWLADIVDLFERTTKLVVSPYVEGLRDNPGGAPRQGIEEAGIPKTGFIDKHRLGFVRHMGNIVQALPAKFFDGFRFQEETFKHGTQSFQVAGASFSRGFVLAYMEDVYVEHLYTTVGQEKMIPEYFEALKKAKQEKYKRGGDINAVDSKEKGQGETPVEDN